MPRRQTILASAGSVYARLEEIILASSGADAFELVFALATARLIAVSKRRRIDASSGARARRDVQALVRGARRAFPGLEPEDDLPVPDDVLLLALGLLDIAALEGDAEGLDALFERLTSRVGKGDKGQFFTPRHVVDFATRALGLSRGELFVDPACGSGAFVVHACAAAAVDARGFDVDARAVRVAKLLSLATGADPERITRRDSLGSGVLDLAGRVDAIATNPPFAGAAVMSSSSAERYELAGLLRRRLERDALFLERCITLLRPGGRLAIVLPYGKVAAPSWAPLRRWLAQRARVFAVVSLPHETFLPHTSQRTALLLAQKRGVPTVRATDERVLLAVSERAGRDAGGEPIGRHLRTPGRRGPAEGRRLTWRDLDHDLAELEPKLRKFLAAEAFAGGAG